jgi:DNA-binding transcriptional ArsR family regulator
MNAAAAQIDVFRSIADPTRRAILDRLRAGPAAVNALAADFEQTRPAISKCVFRIIVTGRFGIVTAEFGNVTGHFGDVTDGLPVAQQTLH